MPGSPLSAIEHIVVLMLENRSFDSLLGFLYDPRNKNAPFNRLPPATGSPGFTSSPRSRPFR